MRSAASRLHKGFSFAKRFQGCSDWICCDGAAWAGPAPEHVEQTAPLSLVSYLPDNLEQLDYIPHGMQGCVENLRNRNARERARGKQEFRPPVI